MMLSLDFGSRFVENILRRLIVLRGTEVFRIGARPKIGPRFTVKQCSRLPSFFTTSCQATGEGNANKSS